MKSARILTILFLAFGLTLCSAVVTQAEPMGTAFTYQGHLYDANYAANGLYDFTFGLYDASANVAHNQVGTDVNVANVEVIDGYFTVELDFGDVFDGDARWLEIGVRPGELDDPNEYTTLLPWQEVMPTPYALYAERAGVGSGSDSDWMVDGNDMYSIPSGNVGIGTEFPGAKLEINGQVKITGGSPEEGRVLTSDASGLGSWQTPAASNDSDWTISGNDMYSAVSGNVGIGTNNPKGPLHIYCGNSGVVPHELSRLIIEDDFYMALQFISPSHTQQILFGDIDNYDQGYISYVHADDSMRFGTSDSLRMTIAADGDVGIGTMSPGAKLEVNGQVKITGGSPGAGKILTSDASGLGSWQTFTGGGDITAVIAGTGLNGGGTSGDVTLGVEVPFSLSYSGSGGTISAFNSGSGSAVYGNSLGSGGTSIYGASTGWQGRGVYGYSSQSGYGGYFYVDGVDGKGVYGFANSDNGYGGYFEIDSDNTGIGVYGSATGSSSYGGYFEGNAKVTGNLIVDSSIGIGANPEEKLDVRGKIEVDQKIQAHDSGGLELATDEGTTRLYIRDNGRVFIGTGGIVPKALLHVEGEETNHIAYFENSGGNDANGIAIKLRTHSDHITNRTNNFMTFYRGDDSIAGRIEGFDFDNGDWDNDYPGLPNIGFDIDLDGGSFPSCSLSGGSLPSLYPWDAGSFPTLSCTTPTWPTVDLDIDLGQTNEWTELICWALENDLQNLISVDPISLAVTVFTIPTIQGCKDGGVTYGSKGADYAEWLPKLDPNEEFSFGQIVGVHGGKISKKTKGAEQIMAISLAPVVLGNLPAEGEQENYEKVGFMGQLPVAVRGRVKVGDYIIPSALEDGTGIAVSPEKLEVKHLNKILGRAWSESKNGVFDFIDVAIGIKTNECVKILEEQAEEYAALKAENAHLRAELQSLNTRVSQMVASLEKLEEFAAVQSGINSKMVAVAVKETHNGTN